jgi:hypothetical protein
MHSDRRADARENGIGVLVQIAVPEPESPPAIRLQECVSAAVGRAFGVLIPIKLDDEAMRGASEIRSERADRDLTPKFHPAEPAVSQQLQSWRSASVISLRNARAFLKFWPSRMARRPHPNPLPQAGEGVSHP